MTLAGAPHEFHLEALLADSWGRDRILGDGAVAAALASRARTGKDCTSDAAAYCEEIFAGQRRLT